MVVFELPAFWYSIGMGISLGHYMQEHFTAVQILLFNYGEPGVMPALAERCSAYVRVIVPVLGVSALAEAYAVAETSKVVTIVKDDDDEPDEG